MKPEGWSDYAEFSPDGREIVTASMESAQLWDAVTGRAISQPMKHGGRVECARFSPDGRRVVTASWDNTARLWDAATGNPIGEPMKHDGKVTFAQFSPDGKRVATVSSDNTARLWDALTGKEIGVALKHGGPVSSADFSPDGQRVLTASYDDTARLWDVPTVTGKDTPEDILLLADLAEATGGVSIKPTGQADIRNALTPDRARATRDRIGARFAGLSLTPLQQCMNWSVSDPGNRTISPFSKLTVGEWIENRIKEGSVDGLRAAIRVDPINARLTAHLGKALMEQALDKETGADEARRDKGEADFQTRRALKLAPDNDELKNLRAEVVKLLGLNRD
jgi:dipeptidyl aminopeptidase/acylaminoacyl peptidase